MQQEQQQEKQEEAPPQQKQEEPETKKEDVQKEEPEKKQEEEQAPPKKSLDEISNEAEGFMNVFWAQLDVNGDGFFDKNELERVLEAQREALK